MQAYLLNVDGELTHQIDRQGLINPLWCKKTSSPYLLKIVQNKKIYQLFRWEDSRRRWHSNNGNIA